MFLTSAGMGFLLSDRLNKRLKNLEIVLIFLDRLKTCLVYQNFPTKEIIDFLAEDSFCKSLPFITVCQELLKKQNNFPSAWKKAVQQTKGQMNLTEADLSPIFSLSDIIGSADVEHQISALLMTEELLKRQREEAEEAKRKKGRLYRSLGALAGVGMVIILI